MNHLRGPQITVLALWSYGIVFARTCGLNRVAATLAGCLGEKEDNLRQRLREWYWDKEDKRGKRRVDWQVSQSFGPLLKWILKHWTPEEKTFVLAMDVTSLKRLFVVLSISVVYRGCAIPIAWEIRPAEQPGSWKEPWLSLFDNVQGILPTDWQVLVMADRGLYARWLYEAIQKCGWHPFLRINLRSHYCPPGRMDFRPMSQLLSSPGSTWAGGVTCFANNSIHATLLACWETHHKEPWLIVTDLSPDLACASWYSLRSWIEDLFKDIKRDGWQWQKTRMSDPVRASRLWLALAVATLWVVSVGGEADAHLPATHLDLLPSHHIARRTNKHSIKPRTLSCFSRGLIEIFSALVHNRSMAIGSFFPEPWPLKTYP